ncbi:MAG: hypothetical protein KA991_02150 [Bifidobacterium sp.]|nr:hypothetical protein [Bifidobacterium sp.]
MATVTKKNIDNLQQIGGTPWGNLTGLEFTFETNASGVWVDSDQATAVGIADVCKVGRLPAGFRLLDAKIVISDAFTANSTFDLGFAYVDGVDVTAVPQDADYFFNDLDEAVGLTFKTNTTAPVTLPKDAYLILTNNTAAQAAAGAMNILVTGILTGTP